MLYNNRCKVVCFNTRGLSIPHCVLHADLSVKADLAKLVEVRCADSQSDEIGEKEMIRNNYYKNKRCIINSDVVT